MEPPQCQQMPNSRLTPFTRAAKRQSWPVVGPRMIDRGVMRPFSTSDISVAQFMPGADGLRACQTNQGPILFRVAVRVACEFSRPQCLQVAEPTSAT